MPSLRGGQGGATLADQAWLSASLLALPLHPSSCPYTGRVPQEDPQAAALGKASVCSAQLEEAALVCSLAAPGSSPPSASLLSFPAAGGCGELAARRARALELSPRPLLPDSALVLPAFKSH